MMARAQFIPSLGGSDHEAFLEAGVPSTYIWTDWAPQWAENPPKWKNDEVFIDGIPYYHSSADMPENTVMIEPWNMVYVARFASLLTTRVCDFTSNASVN